MSSMEYRLARPRPRRRQGFTLAEVALALVVFMMITLVFAASFPLVSSQAQAGDNYSQAAMLAQHKLDQIRSAGFTALSNPSTGTLPSLGILDTNSLSATSVPYTATFTTVDNLAATNGPGSGYFPTGTVGEVQVQDLKTVNSALSTPTGTVYLVTVTIQWPGSVSVGGHYSVSTLVAQQGKSI